jgi:plasmid stabilization system protein ParE
MPGTRELVVSETVYILVYRVRGNTLTILRVMHSKRFFPPIA